MRKRTSGSRVYRIVEVRRVEAEAQPETLHQRVAEPRHRADVVENRLAEAGNIREEIAAVQRRPGGDARVAVRQLRAEVQPFLEIRPPPGQLSPHRKVAAPRQAAQLHADRQLRLERLCEEAPAERFEPRLQSLVDAMSDDVEEAGATAGVADLSCPERSRRACPERSRRVAPSGDEGRDIDHRKGGHDSV